MTFPDSGFGSVSASLRAGNYNLLLGSGISKDSRNKHGLLTSGEELRQHLCKLKGAHSNSRLQRVYSTLTPTEVQNHIVERFLDCSPGPSVNKLTSFLWRRIFTFNIDDALEHAYQTPNHLQSPTVFHFEDDYSEVTNLSQVPIVHLHGWVKQANRGFVFSPTEYVRQTVSINPWMVLLTQCLPVEPFIILGTSLDEADLDYYLAHRTTVTSREDRGPSILVEPNPDAVTADDCRKHNLLLFEGTAEQFLDALLEHVPDRPTPIELVSRKLRTLLPPSLPSISALSFASDFELVPGIVTPDFTVSRFLYGRSPTWQDLSSKKDIGRPITARILEAIDAHLRMSRQSPGIIIVEDQTGTGKTTIVRRCMFELAAMGYSALVCSVTGKIEPVSTASIMSQIRGPVIVLVDDFADHVRAIRQLAEHLTKPDVVFLCAERRYRLPYVMQTLSGCPIEAAKISGLRLRTVDAARLIERYREFGLLGAHNALRDGARFADSIKSDPIAIACCRILNDFRPLDTIIESLLSVTSQQDLKRYLTSSLAYHCFRSGVRYSVLNAISDRKPWDRQLTSHHELPLSATVQDHESFIVPENATLSTLLLDRISKTNRTLMLSVFVDLANGIAPRVNPQEIRRRRPEARISARLFDYDQVVFPFLGDRSTSFYSETKSNWNWNSRYWTQVALMHLTKYYENPSSSDGRDALDIACSHARHARSIEIHPVVLSTLGKVLFAQVVDRSQDSGTIFEEAFSVLTEAIELQRNWLRPAGHPFVTLFRGTSDYIETGGAVSSRHYSVLRTLWSDAELRFQGDRDVEESLFRIDRYL